MLVCPQTEPLRPTRRSIGVDITVNGADWSQFVTVSGRIDPISESGRGYRAVRERHAHRGTGRLVRSEVDGMHAVDVDGRRITAPERARALVHGRRFLPSPPRRWVSHE